MAKLFNAHSDRFPLHYIDQYVEMEPQVEEIDPEVAKIIEKERRFEPVGCRVFSNYPPKSSPPGVETNSQMNTLHLPLPLLYILFRKLLQYCHLNKFSVLLEVYRSQHYIPLLSIAYR